MNDEVRHAYARFGLPVTASPDAVRRRFRTLVRIWHPDRFAADAQGLREATERMAQINRDYRLLNPSRERGLAEAPEAPPARTLTRDEVETLVNALGAAGPVDVLLGEVDRLLLVFLFGALGVRPVSEYRPGFSRAGLVLMAAVTGFATLGCLAAGWTLGSRGGESDPLVWLLFVAAAVFGFIALTDMRELWRARHGPRNPGRRTRA
jgi:hypothetical protein